MGRKGCFVLKVKVKSNNSARKADHYLTTLVSYSPPPGKLQNKETTSTLKNAACASKTPSPSPPPCFTMQKGTTNSCALYATVLETTTGPCCISSAALAHASKAENCLSCVPGGHPGSHSTAGTRPGECSRTAQSPFPLTALRRLTCASALGAWLHPAREDRKYHLPETPRFNPKISCHFEHL